MIFNPQNLIKKKEDLFFSSDVKATAHSCLNIGRRIFIWGDMIYVTLMGVCGFESIEKHKMLTMNTQTALLRKVIPIDGDCAKAGWAEFDVGCL